MTESERGCGWRKIGGVYLTADQGMSVSCDALPLELKPCDCCEYEIVQARSCVPYHAGYLASLLKDHVCKDKFACPLCFYGKPYRDLKATLRNLKNRLDAINYVKEASPDLLAEKAELEEKIKDLSLKVPKDFFVMWVSKEFYSPETFIKEAKDQGISKRVAANSLPVGFMVGRDWIFLAHGEVNFYRYSAEPLTDANGDKVPQDVTRGKGIFYAFKPQRLELVLWKGTDAETIQQYEDAGYYVVLIERTKENIERHGDGGYPPLPVGRGKAVRKVGKEAKKKRVTDNPKSFKDTRSFNDRHTIPNPVKHSTSLADGDLFDTPPADDDGNGDRGE